MFKNTCEERVSEAGEVQGREIQCAHGDTTSYPIAKVDLVVEERDITVEPDTLPQSVLLGVDVTELEDFTVHNRKESDGSAFVVTTRTSATREQ